MSNEFSINILQCDSPCCYEKKCIVAFSTACDKLVDKWVKDHGQNSDKGIKAGAAPVSFKEVEKVDRREIYDPKV